jgi:hypothetical protein
MKHSFKSDKNNGYFIRRLIHIFDNIALISPYNEKCFGKKYAEEIKIHILCSKA